MAMNSKGSRPVSVDGESYRCSFKGPGAGDRALLVVQSASGRGPTLIAHADGFYNVWLHFPKSPPGGFAACTPAMVRDVIRAARDAGWTPSVTGPDFYCVWSGGDKVVLRVRAGSTAQ